jgi:hypothetical protein
VNWKTSLLGLAALVLLTANEASAAGRRARVSQPAADAVTTAPAAVPTTLLPTPAEITAVPEPGQGRLLSYGLNLHPGARMVRRVLGR